MSKKVESDQITVAEIYVNQMRFNIVGTSPLVPHAMSFKAAGDLLFPPPKKNAAEKATTLKHEPFDEFRAAAYVFRDEDDEPTRLYFPGSSFHSSMAQASIDMIGVKKAQIARLTSVPQMKLPLYGVPKIWTTIVRSADMNKTPDVRTLPILPKWALQVEIEFIGSLIKPESIANILAAAGRLTGVGDGRPEKGKLSMGRFRLASDDDPEFLEIVNATTRHVQDVALADPQFYDIETERLLNWWLAEHDRRKAMPARPSKRKTTTVEESAEAPAFN